MSAWILIGYLSLWNSSGGGGPISAEFGTREACLTARDQLLTALEPFKADAKILHCVPKGGPANG